MDLGWKWNKVSMLASSVSVWQPWESYLAALGFQDWSVKGGNNDIASSDAHRSQAGNIQQGGYFFVLHFSKNIIFLMLGKGRNIGACKSTYGVSESSQAQCQPVYIFQQEPDIQMQTFWLVSQTNHSIPKWGLPAWLRDPRATSPSCCENEMR